MITLEEACNYLREDFDELEPSQKSFIELLISDSEIFVEDSIGLSYETKKLNSKFITKCKTIMLPVIADSYENRSIIADKKQDYTLMFGSKLLQMRYGTYL